MVKVNQTQGGNVDPARRLAPGEIETQAHKAARGKAGTGKSDSVDLSERALLLQKADAAAKAAADVREGEVERIRKQIESGSYEVDPSLIARKLLDRPES